MSPRPAQARADRSPGAEGVELDGELWLGTRAGSSVRRRAGPQKLSLQSGVPEGGFWHSHPLALSEWSGDSQF